MNRQKLEQLRRVRELRRQRAARTVEQARRLQRRREAVVSSEQSKLESLQEQCRQLMAAGRPENAASADELVLADHQIGKVRQRIMNQREVLAKAVKSRDEATEQMHKAMADLRQREQKVEAIDSHLKDISQQEARRASRAADDEAEELARFLSI